TSNVEGPAAVATCVCCSVQPCVQTNRLASPAKSPRWMLLSATSVVCDPSPLSAVMIASGTVLPVALSKITPARLATNPTGPPNNAPPAKVAAGEATSPVASWYTLVKNGICCSGLIVSRTVLMPGPESPKKLPLPEATGGGGEMVI